LTELQKKVNDKATVRTDPPNLEDLESIDRLIRQFFPIALETEQDFDRAAKAAYLVLELIDIHTELLVSVAQTYREFSFFP
jgi:hypothetical protein